MNALWKEPEYGVDYYPYKREDLVASWEPMGRIYAPTADCHSDKGYVYYVNKEGLPDKEGREEEIPFQCLPVNWLKEDQRYRSSFGFLIRNRDTEEILALIHQESGWWWRFMIKNNTPVYERFEKRDGWVWQTMTKCVFARIFHCLMES